MDASIFIAQFLGIFFLIIGVGFALHPKHYHSVIREVMGNPGLKFFAGLLPLILGTFFLLCQRSWSTNWHIFVTVICWIIFLKGAIRILFPQRSDVSLVKYMSKPKGYKICSLITIVIALLLCYYGFFSPQLMMQ